MQFLKNLQKVFQKKESTIYVFIRYAHLSKVSIHKNRPKHYSSENCFYNFIQNTDLKKVQVSCLLDTYYPLDQSHFLQRQHFFPIIKHRSGTESQSFLFLLDYVKSLRLHPESIVYFLEEDYLHRKNWHHFMLEGFTLEIDYLTLYDHFDKYTDAYPDLQSRIHVTPKIHWRETPSTTNTYAMKMKTLLEDFEIHKEFSMGCNITRDHDKFRKLKKQGKILVSALPAFSTHCEVGLMSPCIDWEEEILQTQK